VLFRHVPITKLKRNLEFK